MQKIATIAAFSAQARSTAKAGGKCVVTRADDSSSVFTFVVGDAPVSTFSAKSTSVEKCSDILRHKGCAQEEGEVPEPVAVAAVAAEEPVADDDDTSDDAVE